MQNSKQKFFALVLFAGAFITSAMARDVSAQTKRPAKGKPQPAATKPEPPTVSYTVSMPRPATHLLEVEMRIDWKQMPAELDLKMPVWTPGSYLIREYARHVQNFAAGDGSADQLKWSKANKNTWRIITKGKQSVTVTYKVYANELTVRTNELNDEHAFWNNSALLLFIKDQLAIPAEVTVKPFGNWRIATGLKPVDGRNDTFRAENFDVLYDSPFEVSDFKEISFEVAGKQHRMIFTGEGNYDLRKCAADTAKIVEETFKIFGELPYGDYLFIVNLRGGGGLEHANSTALQFNRFGFKPESRYKSFLGLVAHEFFHAFNVKRIRPDALGPFDYENENYTTLLWAAEGGTEYYSNILMLRAGLLTVNEFLSGRADVISKLQDMPGRFETSLEAASFDAWIKYYRQDENAVNNQISYYDKGEVVMMMLDISIRTASKGERSLDDVMRSLYNDFYKKGRNYSPSDIQRAAESAAGVSLADFFERYIRGTDEVDWEGIASGIGLTLKRTGRAGRAYLGAELGEEAGRLIVRQIPAGSPAWEYGLNTGDQILAIDGFRTGRDQLQAYIGERRPGDTVKLTVFRFDRLREIVLTLGDDPRRTFTFKPVTEPNDLQRQLYKAYLNAEL